MKVALRLLFNLALAYGCIGLALIADFCSIAHVVPAKPRQYLDCPPMEKLLGTDNDKSCSVAEYCNL
jgi:hypothetical protein